MNIVTHLTTTLQALILYFLTRDKTGKEQKEVLQLLLLGYIGIISSLVLSP